MEKDGRHQLSGGWAVRFPCEHVDEVARLWDVAGVEVFEDGDHVWFRGSELHPDVDAVLRGFLSGKRFLVLPDGQLQSPKELVPKGRLPEGPWIALRHWLQLEFPLTRLAGCLTERSRLVWVRSPSPVEPQLMLSDLQHWTQFGARTAEVRLKPLKFAQDLTGRVAIYGSPLPAIPGQRFAIYGSIAVPAGWLWSPAVDSSVIAGRLDLPTDDLAILHLNGDFEHVPATCFVAATRQAIRRSAMASPAQH